MAVLNRSVPGTAAPCSYVAIVCLFTLLGCERHPDVVISSGAPTLASSSAPTGGDLDVSAFTVRNQGDLTTGRGFSNGRYLSVDATIGSTDTPLENGDADAPELEPGVEHPIPGTRLRVPCTVAEGSYYFGFLADSTALIDESNETNNASATVPVHVKSGGADIRLRDDVSVIPNRVSPGERLSASQWTVINAGCRASSGNAPGFANGFYLSTDETINASDHLISSSSDLDSPHLMPGGTQAMPATKLSISSSLPLGTYYLGLLLDRHGGVNEENEANNAIVIKTILVGR